MGYPSGEAFLQAMPSIISSAGQVAGQLRGHDGSSDAKKELEARARMREMDAMEEARNQRQQAAKTTEQLREEKQRLKARSRTMWGKSGVGMSGSAARVMDGRDSDAEYKIQNVQGEAEERAKYALATGRDAANSIRRTANRYDRPGVDPFAFGQSVLGLGKRLFNL